MKCDTHVDTPVERDLGLALAILPGFSHRAGACRLQSL
jgi:hypothetical protein